MEPEGLYYIVSNETAYGKEIASRHPKNVKLVKGDVRDTYDLLLLPEVQEFIDGLKADVLDFQNTLRIERLSKEKNWNLLNPSASLSKTVEEKISQITWLDTDAKFLPPFVITTLKEVNFSGKRFVLQFNHAHTGQGTYVIDSSEALENLKSKFPHRECRVTDFIDGPVFTANVSLGREIVLGNPSYQITGISPFTDMPFSTIGNDWALPKKDQYKAVIIDMTTIAQAVGVRLKKFGWKGLFGIDVIYDPKKKKTYLLEINARQPASTTFESQLQKNISSDSPTMFEEHIAALLGLETKGSLPEIKGAQIVKRVTKETYDVDVAALESKDLFVMAYENNGHNKELFRIQATAGIMETHNKLGELGTFIRSCIRKI